MNVGALFILASGLFIGQPAGAVPSFSGAARGPQLGHAAPPKLVIMPLQSSGLAASSVVTLDELLVDFVRKLGEHEVIGKSDIDAMLGLENLKDQLGCDEVACAAEIGGALGAR